ncbi:MAG: HAD-IA family hydrolase [Acidobacteriota bacterium]
MASQVRAIFLDAGNTLLFPQIESIVQDLEAAGFQARVEHFREAERAGKRNLDKFLWPQIREGHPPRSANLAYWEHFLRALLEQIGATAENRQLALDLVIRRFRDIRTWSRVLPETVGVLNSLKSAGFFLAVVSNSDGSVEGQLQRAGLDEFLEFVIDSAVVGVEKPHPEIFEIALERAHMAPQNAVYVGDTYATDIGGAELAGLRGILMDPVGAYPDAACPRITSLSELSALVGAPCL